MAQTDFNKLIDRYLNDQTSPEESRKIDIWMKLRKSSDEDRQWSDEDKALLYARIIDPSVTVEDIRHFQPRTRRLWHHPALRIAAGLIILFIAVWSVWPLINKSAQQQKEAISQIEKVILPEGSIVWLQPHSKLTWYTSGDQMRHVILEGEGLFEVAKDSQHPFTVSCGDITATVLGTSFSLKITASQTIVLNVLTGKVKLSSSSDTQGIEVLPNEKITYAVSGVVNDKVVFGDAEKEQLIASTDYNMKFADTPMSEVFDRIGKKFEVNVKVEGEAVTRCRLTADLTDHSLDNTLLMIAETMDMHYEIKGKSVTISGNGCP